MAPPKLSGIEKAAILLKSLPAHLVEQGLQHLDARHASALRAELLKAGDRADWKEAAAAVFQEVAAMLAPAPVPVLAAGPEVRAPRPAGPPPGMEGGNSHAMASPGRVDLRLAEPPVASEAHADPLQAIAEMPPDLLAQALENESTRTVALLMNNLEVEVAGQIYKRLSPAKRKDVSMKFTEQALIDPALLRRLAQAVVQKCAALRASAGGASEPGAREKRIAALLRGLERPERMEMLAILEQNDAALAGRIKSMLYQFEDILRMQNISVQKLLMEVDTSTLAQAQSGAAPELRDKLLSNLSKRAQESLREEMELLGAVPAAKSRQAQQKIVEAIQGLDQRGELAMIE